MKKKEHARFTGWHLHFAIASTIFLLCAVVIFACFQYYTKLQETVKAETGGYLQEISKQIGANTSHAIEDNFTLLATAAMLLENSGISNFAQLDTIMEEQQQHWIFKHILLVDHHGVAYDTHGNSSLLESAPYLQEAIVARKRSMSTSQMMGNTECVVFALPLDGLTLNGTEIAALIGTYDLSTFDRILSMTAFDGKGYGYIIRRDGTVVIPSSSPFAPKTGYNLLSSLMNASFAGIEKANTIVSNIAHGKTGQAELTMDGVSLYMAYTPLKTQEWYLLTFVPVAVANAKSILLLRMTALLCALITLIFCTLLITLGLSTYRHKRKLEQIAYIDPITGGNTIQRFYVQVAELLAHPNLPQYALIYTNISKFKVLNEQLGRAVCDIILTTLSKSIQKDLDSHECLGRLFADNF
ncbi:MAG: cache domain-containing protein, partial [Hungatella sp.]